MVTAGCEGLALFDPKIAEHSKKEAVAVLDRLALNQFIDRFPISKAAWMRLRIVFGCWDHLGRIRVVPLTIGVAVASMRSVRSPLV